MADRRKVVRRSTKPAKVVEEEIEEEPILEVEDEDEEEPEDDVEEEKPAPRAKRGRGRPAKVVKAPEPEDEEEEEEDEDEEPAPKSTRRTRPVALKVAKEEGEEEGEEPTLIGKASGAGLMDILLRVLDSGREVHITRVGDKYVMTGSSADTEAATRAAKVNKRGVHKAYALTKSEMEAIALNPEWVEWNEWWKELSFEEKVKEAKKAKATWEEIDDPLAANLRVSLAYRKAKGIEKWLPEYILPNTRKELQRFGLPGDDE